jgi:hypothetical protein
MLRRVSLLLTLALSVISLVLGQAETTGRVMGTILNQANQPIAGASVKITGASLQGERTVTTDARGRFTLPLLPPGAYELTVNAAGKQEGVVAFTLGLGKTLDIPISLLDESKVEIEVTAAASKLQTTANGENFSYDRLVEELPIQNRTLEAVAFNAPNIAAGPSSSTLQISGANSFDTLVLLEGAEISDPYFGSSPTIYFEDAIDEVQVLTSGVSARYGRFSGGVLNAVTKRGGNEFEGTLRTELTNEKWNSATPFGESREDDLGKVFSLTGGGYIVKDRLWWFAGGRKFDNSIAATAADGNALTSNTDETRYQVKLRGAVSSNHVIEGNYLDYDAEVTNLAALPVGHIEALSPLRRDPRTYVTLSYQGILNDSLILEASATRKRVEIFSGGVDTAHSPVIDLARFLVYNNSWFDGTQSDERSNNTFSTSLTYTRDWAKAGSHVLELGVQAVESIVAGDNRQSATGFNVLNLSADLTDDDGQTYNLTSFFDDGFNLRWEAIPLGGEQKVDYKAAYVHDSISKGNWRFDAGIRWEKTTGDGPLTSNIVEYDAISPRLGVTYNTDGQWQLQATYGHYQARFNDNYANNISGVGGAPRFSSVYLGPSLMDVDRDTLETAIRDDSGWAVIDFDGPQFPVTVFDRDLESSYTREFTLAAKRAIGGGKGEIAVTYNNRDYRNLIDDFFGSARIIEVPNPDGGDPFEFDQKTWRNNGAAEREYQAVSFTWDYRPNATWTWGGNYTYSTLRGNYIGEAANQPASGSQQGDYPNSIFPGTEAPYGRLYGDLPHRLRTWGTYQFDLKRFGSLVVGALAAFTSGDVWERSASIALPFDDPNSVGDAGQSYNYFFESRGANRFPSRWELNLSSRWQFPIYKDLAGWLKLDVRNATNNDSLIAFDTSGSAASGPGGQLVFAPSSTFGQATGPGSYQVPRTYLVTLGLKF